LKVLHINSTRQGGGVAEILSSLRPLMNEVGIETDWLVIDGSPEFFAFTKDIHNALHGEPIQLAAAAMRLHRDVACINGAKVGSTTMMSSSCTTHNLCPRRAAPPAGVDLVLPMSTCQRHLRQRATTSRQWLSFMTPRCSHFPRMHGHSMCRSGS
jgi:hypothetical protein